MSSSSTRNDGTRPARSRYTSADVVVTSPAGPAPVAGYLELGSPTHAPGGTRELTLELVVLGGLVGVETQAPAFLGRAGVVGEDDERVIAVRHKACVDGAVATPALEVTGGLPVGAQRPLVSGGHRLQVDQLGPE